MQLIKNSLPVPPKAIEEAVNAFSFEVETQGDREGFVTQTMTGIAAAIYQNSGDFWLWIENGEVAGYVLGRLVIDIDNSLTYWLSQAYVAPKHRGTKAVKEAWEKVREQGKQYLCKHIVVVSARGTDAYCRFLGKGYHEYARLLKEDL